jgi:IclR family acetate operon transcriptional repressor
MPKQKDPEAGESIALRAFAMLEKIAAAPAAMSLDEMTHAMALPKPTVFRILNMLHTAKLLRREQIGKRYTIGPRLAAFGSDLWRNAALRAQWHRALEACVKETGESCNLTVLDGNEVLYLDRVETSHPLRMHLEAGTRVPLHCTASGKLFLSQLATEGVKQLMGDEPYTAYTKSTITDLAVLEEELKRVRKTRVGTHDGELFADSVAVAIPVLGARGVMVAAIALHAPSSRGNLKALMRYLPALRRAGETISSTMAAKSQGARAGEQSGATRASAQSRQGPIGG